MNSKFFLFSLSLILACSLKSAAALPTPCAPQDQITIFIENLILVKGVVSSEIDLAPHSKERSFEMTVEKGLDLDAILRTFLIQRTTARMLFSFIKKAGHAFPYGAIIPTLSYRAHSWSCNDKGEWLIALTLIIIFESYASALAHRYPDFSDNLACLAHIIASKAS